MATLNPFDILGDDDTEDPTQLVAKIAPLIKDDLKKASAQPHPTKPLPSAQRVYFSVREAKSDAPRGGRGGFQGGNRGRGFSRGSAEKENSFGNSNGYTGGYQGSHEGEAGKTLQKHGSGPRDGFRGGRRGGFNNGDAVEGERPQRAFERRSGTGRGTNFRREGAGRGNWGTPTDETTPEAEERVAEVEKAVVSEKLTGQDEPEIVDKDIDVKESEEKDTENKEMTLEEYEKLREEKRKALLALKPEERKVNLDKEFESMQLLDNKKNDEDVSVKLASEKEKRKDAMEKAKKSLSINEFLKPVEGQTYQRSGGRGRGRGQGRGDRNYNSNVKAPSIEDVGQFPSLSGK